MSTMKKITLLYITLIHLLLILALMKTNLIELMEAKINSSSIEKKDKCHINTVSFHKRIDKNVTTKTIPFFGDSLVQGLSTSSIAPNIINYGIGNDTIQSLITRLEYYTNSLMNAEFVFVSIGVNDLIKQSPSEVLVLYKTLIIELRKKSTAPIFINSIFPINEAIEYHQRKNNNIRTLNSLLLNQVVAQNENIYYIDSYQQMLNLKTNELSKKFNIGDGIHLNEAGNKIWILNIKHTIEKFLNDKY